MMHIHVLIHDLFRALCDDRAFYAMKECSLFLWKRHSENHDIRKISLILNQWSCCCFASLTEFLNSSLRQRIFLHLFVVIRCWIKLLRLSEFRSYCFHHHLLIHLRLFLKMKFHHKTNLFSILFLKFLRMMFQSFLIFFFTTRLFNDVQLISLNVHLIFY
jgi:hypothetical protein